MPSRLKHRTARWRTTPELGAGIRYQWTGATWAIDGSGRAYNTPTPDVELLTNGNMETGSPPSSWTLNSGATLSSVADERTGGAGAKSLNALRGTNDHSAFQGATITAGQWLQTSGWLKNIDATNVNITLNYVLSVVPNLTSVSTSWTFVIGVARVNTAGGNLRLHVTTSGNGRFDDISLRHLLSATLFRTISNTSSLSATASINTIAATTQAGVVSLLDSTSSPANFLIAYHEGGSSVKLDKCVAGTYTNLVTATASFVSNALIEIRPLGSNQFDLYYNGTKRGSTATVNDAGILSNTNHGLFSTYSGNVFGDFIYGGQRISF